MVSTATATTVAGQHRQVYEGRAEKTTGGLRKHQLVRSRSTGKIVSKKKSALGKKNDGPLREWRNALKSACKEKKVPYQIPRKNTALYKLAKKHMSKKTKTTRRKRTKCNMKKRNVCKKSKTCTWVKRTKTRKVSRKGYCRKK